MKTQKVNGKVGFEACSIVVNYLVQLLGADWRKADLVTACESNLNEWKAVKSKSSFGGVTTKAKQGLSQYTVATSETMQGKADVVSAFMTWHDRVESRAAKALKDGVQSTVVGLPDSCGFADWLSAFRVNTETAVSKAAAKAAKAAKAAAKAANAETALVVGQA